MRREAGSTRSRPKQGLKSLPERFDLCVEGDGDVRSRITLSGPDQGSEFGDGGPKGRYNRDTVTAAFIKGACKKRKGIERWRVQHDKKAISNRAGPQKARRERCPEEKSLGDKQWTVY